MVDDDDDDDMGHQVPCTSRAEMKGHTRAVSAIAIDPKGVRVATGGHDYMLRMWDFGGMNEALESFRTVEVEEGHPIYSVAYSPSGDQLIVATGSCQPKIYDREGHFLHELPKGDMYLYDPKHCKGHTHSMVGVAWHPTEKNTVYTGSSDGTMRVWDIHTDIKSLEKAEDMSAMEASKMLASSKRTLKARGVGGKRCPLTAMATSKKSGKYAVAGCVDGSLQVWNVASASSSSNPDMYLKGAAGGKITAVTLTQDDTKLAARADDGYLRVFDMRKLKSPLFSVPSLPSLFDGDALLSSPDDDLFVTAATRQEGGSTVYFFDTMTMKEVHSEVVAESAVSSLAWHPAINQIFCGCVNGSVVVMYDEELSHRGVLPCLQRKKKKRDAIEAMDFGGVPEIYTPETLPFREGPYTAEEKKEEIRRNNALKKERERQTKKPEMPMTGPGVGGKVGTSWSKTVVDMFGLARDDSRFEDPREAILKHADAAAANPMYVNHAYKDTQPTAVYDVEGALAEQEEKEKLKEMREKYGDEFGAKPKKRKERPF